MYKEDTFQFIKLQYSLTLVIMQVHEFGSNTQVVFWLDHWIGISTTCDIHVSLLASTNSSSRERRKGQYLPWNACKE